MATTKKGYGYEMKQYIFVATYLIAIVLANLAVAYFGINSVYIVAFILIGLDLTSRDFLHEYWKTGKWWKMGLLIGIGSLISWLLNKDAGMVAIRLTVLIALSMLWVGENNFYSI